MKNNLKSKLFMAVFILVIFIVGCSKKDNEENTESNMPDYFGTELYSIACGYTDDDYLGGKFTFQVMSKTDISEYAASTIDYEGGEFDYRVSVTKGEDKYKLDDYNLYVVTVEIENILFDDEKIEIDSVTLYGNGEKDKIVLKPQRFELIHIQGVESNELVFVGTPLSMPYDMNYLSYDLNVKEKVIITDVKLINEDLKLINKENYRNIEIIKNENIAKKVDIDFQTANELSKYMQYQSSVVFYFKVNDEEYINKTPIEQFIYNDLLEYENNLEKYYNEVLLKGN